MLRKFTENLLVIVVAVGLVVAACAVMFNRVIQRQEAALAPLREQNEALRAQEEDNRREIAATGEFLRQAVGRSESGVFRPAEEVERMNQERIDALADAIARKVAPALPAPKSPEELSRQEDEEVDRIATSTAEKLGPDLAGLAGDRRQALTEIARDQDRIESLSSNLQATQKAAQQALALTQQVSSMYLNSFHDQGVVARILNLPADLMRDAAGGNVIDSRDRAKVQQQLDAEMQEIEKSLNQIQVQSAGASMAHS